VVSLVVGVQLASGLALVGLRAMICLGRLRLMRCIGVRLLDLASPGERLRRKTWYDRELTEGLLVRGEYALGR
jgi:hypothetical protein